MSINLDEIKKACDLLFASGEEAEEAFSSQPLLDEIERAMAHVNDGNSINVDFFNRVLTAGLLGPVAAESFARYFPVGINSFEKLSDGVEKFAKDALLHFGSLHQAFLRIKADPAIVLATAKEFGGETRARFGLSRQIDAEKLAYLGYVSGELPKKMSDAHRTILEIVDPRSGSSASSVAELKAAATEKGVDLEKELRKLNEGLVARMSQQVTIEEYLERSEEIEAQIGAFVEEVKVARADGLKNLEQYINVCNGMDVYVATSMRDDQDYRDMSAFVSRVFGRSDVERLRLRYFDPTQAFCANKYDKGMVECLMIRCAKVTIYCAQKQDTMGKDSELAITLGQGKPVIAYIPEGEEYDQRARVFSEVHPLSLQVDQRTGNTNGIMVVRTADECADILYALAKADLAVEVRKEEETDPISGQHSVYWVLREAITKNRSVIRVVSGWRHLRTAFWSAYRPDLHIP